MEKEGPRNIWVEMLRIEALINRFSKDVSRQILVGKDLLLPISFQICVFMDVNYFLLVCLKKNKTFSWFKKYICHVLLCGETGVALKGSGYLSASN